MNYISEETLATIILDYWKSRGYKVDVEVSECTRTGKVNQVVAYRAVRSNLMNAMPRGYSGELGVIRK